MTKDRPLFTQVNIVSRDLAVSAAFYRLLGLDIPELRVWGNDSGPHHVGAVDERHTSTDFDLDSEPFAATWNAGWAGRSDLGGKIVVGFSVPTREDVDAIHARMIAAGHNSLTAPHDAFWGSRYAIVEDPDGIAVGIMSPSSDAHRHAPPAV